MGIQDELVYELVSDAVMGIGMLESCFSLLHCRITYAKDLERLLKNLHIVDDSGVNETELYYIVN